MNRQSWEPDQIPTLLYLWRLTVTSGGYKVAGVYGWAHRDDVEEGIRREILGLLPLLHRRGLVDREEARAPATMHSAWLYRVSRRGVQAVAERTERTLALPSEPACYAWDPPMYVPRGKLRALLLLRSASGHDGWVVPRKLREAVSVAELRWLLRAGLIERRDFPAAVRGPVVHWRPTKTGRSVTVLEWREPVALA